MIKQVFLVMIVWSALIFGAHRAKSSVVVSLDLEQLYDHSTVVIEGEVVFGESYFNQDLNRLMTTFVVNVSECFKGSCTEQEVSFDVLGGEMDNLVTRVSGEPFFFEGERVILFLEEIHSSQRLAVTGMAQGKFQIVNVWLEQTALARRQLSGLQLRESEQKNKINLAPDRWIPYKELVGKLQKLQNEHQSESE